MLERRVWAAKPSNWRSCARCAGRGRLIRSFRGETWVAWARDPKVERPEGGGDSPPDALLQLTVNLKSLSA